MRQRGLLVAYCCIVIDPHRSTATSELLNAVDLSGEAAQASHLQ